MSELVGPMFGLLFLLFLSGFFSSSETALMAVSHYRLRYLERHGHGTAGIVRKLVGSPDRLLSTILLGNNFANTAASALATIIAVRIGGESGALVATLIMTALILIFSEIAPKTFAARFPERLSFWVARPLLVIVRVFAPVAGASAHLANALLRPLGGGGRREPTVSEADIQGMIELGEEERVIAREKRRMLQSIFRLTETVVEDIMIPRTQVRAIPVDARPDEILESIRESGHTRFPVYEGSLDQVVGILHSKDVVRHWNRLGEMRLREILRKPFYVPETATLETGLRLFRQHRQHLALVIDEFGGVEGIVSLEDLLEEIVGDIIDEHDRPEEPQLLELAPDILLAEGTCPLSLLEKRYGIVLESRESATLAGFLMELTGGIPQSGDRVRHGDLTFAVRRATSNRIDLVRIEGVPPRSGD